MSTKVGSHPKSVQWPQGHRRNGVLQGTTYRAGARSVVVLIAGKGPMAGISNGVQSTPAEPSSRQECASASSFDRPVIE
jgi:hypothetical protein